MADICWESQLEAFWRDPEFARQQGAVYYAGVPKIPTPRWTSYDANLIGVELPPNVPVTIQERAYTSPVWYWPTIETATWGRQPLWPVPG
jgi:hypothetical protein